VICIKARIFCPTHGRLDLADVVIKSGEPICGRCSSVLVYGEVKPRRLEAVKTKSAKVRGKRKVRKRLKHKSKR